ncbi:MAG: FKBP-type peptidyl-prolyl cis-trans isomerase [Myxococcota bacterium]
MAKLRALAMSVLPLVALACPTETTLRPKSHQLPSSPESTRTPKPGQGKDGGPGVAGIVAEAAEAAKGADGADGEGKAEAPAKEQALARAEPPAGDIPAPPDVAAPPASATKTASGLAYQVLTKGTGTAKPREYDKVEVHYTGWTTDGKMFDSSVKRGRPATFPVGRVIKGWTEGLQLMVVGDKTRFWIPAELAYGDRPGRPQGMLVFDVELLSITEGTAPAPAPPAPDDVAAPPASASKTASGLAYRVLTKGTGGEHPGQDSRVSVHYTGWTTDGKMFDSSITRGKPSTFPLGGVIKGWTEGLQLMVVGDKTRFWIPEALAYQGKPGKPAGMLVFDVELLSIE